MKAAIARQPQAPFEFRDVVLDDPRDDEILVRIKGVGICHTDIAVRDQKIPISLPAVLGHEGAGIVERVGSKVSAVAPGDHVVISFRSCGECPPCRQGHPSYCTRTMELNFSGTRPDGSRTITENGVPVSSNFFGQSSFAEYALAYERNVVRVPTDAPLPICGALACGIQTGAGAVMRVMECDSSSSLLIYGGGTVGLGALLGARARGTTTIAVVEPRAERRQLALSLGATYAIDPGEGDTKVALTALLPEGFSHAFDTTGIEAVIEEALALLAPLGQLGLVGFRDWDAAISVPLIPLNGRGIRIHGITQGDSDPHTFIPELIDLHKEGRFPFDKLVRTYPLSAINEAVRDQHNGDCVKAVLLVD